MERGRFWNRPRIATVALLVAFAATLSLWPAAATLVARSAAYLWARDMTGLRDYLRTFGATAWLVSSLLMVLQSLVAPIPAVAITFANALIYGPWLGALLSWSSAQLAAMICFSIGRAFGRPFIEPLFGVNRVARFDRAFARYGSLALVVARLVPFVSFDLVSYAAGLTRVGALAFFVTTGCGQLPAAIVYSHVGAQLANAPGTAIRYLLWFLGPAVLISGAVWMRMRAKS
ncbi:MAG: VTT domain-containing protein [Planctomycetota bacterium]